MKKTSGKTRAVKFARALVSLASNENAVPTTVEALQSLRNVYQTVALLRRFFENPLVPLTAKEQIVDGPLGEGFPELVRNFLKVILRADAAKDIPSICDIVIDEAHRRVGEIPVELTVARSLPTSVQEKIQKQLEERLHGKVVIKSHVDASVIGGVRILWNGKVLDGTIPGRLRKMEEFLLRGAR